MPNDSDEPQVNIIRLPACSTEAKKNKHQQYSSIRAPMSTEQTLKQAPNVPIGLAPALLVFATVMGSAAGVALVMFLHPLFGMPDELGSMPLTPSLEYMAKYNSAYQSMSIGNGAINFSLIGVAIGVAIALLVATRASAVSRLLTALLGLLGGAVGGAIGGWLLANASATQGRLTIQGFAFDPMLQAVLFQTICWGGIGIGVGVALASCQKLAIGTGVVAGIAGGVIAALAHAVIGSFFFPDTGIVDLLPPSALERFLWATYCASALGLGIYFVMRRAARLGQSP
jgi:hypothetical protein